MQPSIIVSTWRMRHEPTPAQIKSGNYRKKEIAWCGLTLAIENPAGSVRSGTSRDGHSWETRMLYDYGYVKGTKGADGDAVDCFLGPDFDAPMVFIVRQRRVGKWDEYDEDKAMLGFDSEGSARAAFLAAYDDPRFLGEISAMAVDEFVAKVRATKDAPGMVKSIILCMCPAIAA